MNKSTALSDDEVEAIVPALQTQVAEHLAPSWGVGADISFIPKNATPPTDAWQVEIVDTGTGPYTHAVAYHGLSATGLPLGQVFAATAKQSGGAWSIPVSHTLLNMLVNPRINLTVFISSSKGGGTLYALEIADACESEQYAYKIGDILVSDFVYPAWFEPSAKPGVTPFDYGKHIDKPLSVCRHGFMPVYDVKSGEWRQILGN
jgi:hypothetical protein